jgi:hypothetical protein
VLDHIEKTFADAYRKEIDQEENIWRSLPFFAATLAFELATQLRMVDRLLPARSGARRDAVFWIILAGIASLVSILDTLLLVATVATNYIPSSRH